MEKKRLSAAMEDYLRTIYKLEERGEDATTSAISERLGVAPASVTKMLKRLASLTLIEHQPYKGVALTEGGEKAARELVRHHRLIERFLADVVGVPWDRVHDEAHRLEHALSEYLEDRLAEILDHPDTDPHGQPIPTKEGEMPRRRLSPLSSVPTESRGIVAEIEDEDPELLRYVAQRGIFPRTRIEVLHRDPYGGSVIIAIGETQCSIGLDAAKQIWIQLSNPED